MDWQEAIALTIVAATSVLFFWQQVRLRRATFGKHPKQLACGCAAATPSSTTPIITYHAKKGARPVLIVRQPPAPPSQRRGSSSAVPRVPQAADSTRSRLAEVTDLS